MIREQNRVVSIHHRPAFSNEVKMTGKSKDIAKKNNSTAFTFKLDNKAAKILQRKQNMTAFVEAAIMEKDAAERQKPKQ